MRKIARVLLATVTGALILSSCACVSQDAVIKEKKELAKKMLEEKYDEKFDIISVSKGTGGDLTKKKFIATCVPQEHKDCMFQARIVEGSLSVKDTYVSTMVCKKMQARLQELVDSDDVVFYVETSPAFTKYDNPDISIADYTSGTNGDFAIYAVTKQDFAPVKESIYKFTSEYPGVSRPGKSATIWCQQNASDEQFAEFASAAENPIAFAQAEWKYFDEKPGNEDF